MSPILIASYPYTIYMLAIDKIDGTSTATYGQIGREMLSTDFEQALVHLTLNENRLIAPLFYELAKFNKSTSKDPSEGDYLFNRKTFLMWVLVLGWIRLPVIWVVSPWILLVYILDLAFLQVLIQVIGFIHLIDNSFMSID